MIDAVKVRMKNPFLRMLDKWEKNTLAKEKEKEKKERK